MTFERSIDIAAPPEVVWAVMSDVGRWHEWTQSVRGVRLLGRRPLAVGTRALIRQPRYPAALWKVIALEPGRSFTWKSGLPGMWVYARHAVAPAVSGTTATLRLDYEGPLGRLMARSTRDITERYLDFEAAGLKRRSEALTSR